MAEAADIVVIGAGVIGLACARALALQGRQVLVLERQPIIGSETSARNSEVIHAGIYYPSNSLKARLCVAGRALLYEYCRDAGVPHRRCGKLIVATTSSQQSVLLDYQRQAAANGAGSLTWLSGAAVRSLEPEVEAVAGVLSPNTGIIDAHAFMVALQGELEAHGGIVVCNTEVRALARSSTGMRVVTDGMELAPAWVINCGGLHAPGLAAQVLTPAPQAFYARGRYYAYSGPPPFSRLVYPVAEPGGLGIHVTLDLAGQIRFGPDVAWIDEIDYQFDDSRRDAFIDAIARYFPGVQPERLHPGYTGIRPKISGPNDPAADFVIDGPVEHGVPGLVNLLGIESPGLTASLAIAQTVTARMAASRC
jgi:L-2-hydroxyglutarate oxidase LhgO